MSQIGTCALCDQSNAEIQDSHIIPRWAYERTVSYQPEVNTNPVVVTGGTAVETSEQVKKYLLCKCCEDRIGKTENYVAKIAVQEDNGFPALGKVAIIWKPDPSFCVADANLLECSKLINFAASVLWRADIAQIEPIVDLGSFRDQLKQYLLEKGNFPNKARMVLQLLAPTDGTSKIHHSVVFPVTVSYDGYDTHSFLIHGLRFTLYCGSNIPRVMDEYCLIRTHRLIITDGRCEWKIMEPSLINATPKGRLSDILKF